MRPLLSLIFCAHAWVLSGCACARPTGGTGNPSEPVVLPAASAVPATAPPAAASSVDAPVGHESPLHVVVTEKARSAEMPPLVRVCPARGATFLCGTAAVYVARDGAFQHDTALEAGLPHDPSTGSLTNLVDVYGTWPDDAWLVSTHIDVPPFQVTVYRWKTDRWIQVAPERNAFSGVQTILPWGKGGGLVIDEGSSHPAGMRGVGARSGRAAGAPETTAAIAAFDDGVLVAAALPRGGFESNVLRLWPASGGSSAVALPDPVFVNGIASVKARDVVVYGSRDATTDGGSSRAYLARFDGKTLSALEPPPGKGVASYVEDPSGVEWALSTAGESVWRREPNGAWQAVELPLDYQPYDLSVTSDGAVWVRASGPILRGDAGDRLVAWDVALLSTWAPERVLALGAAPLGAP